MRVSFGNARFAAAADTLGGELRSLWDRETGRERLFQADPAWWKGTAPLLFPIVGGLRGGTFRHDGATFPLGQHGFARGSEFELAASGPEGVEFRLRSGAATLAAYPFEFDLRQTYSLTAEGYRHRVAVTNTGRRSMLFSLGFHPAFTLPLGPGGLESHYVLFGEPEELRRRFFKDGLVVEGKTAECFENSRVVALSRELLADGPVIFRSPRSSEFSLVNGKSGESVTLVTGVLPAFAIWSKPGAPFLCLEPWHGLPDSTEASGELSGKEGIMALEPGSSREFGYEARFFRPKRGLSPGV